MPNSTRISIESGTKTHIEPYRSAETVSRIADITDVGSPFMRHYRGFFLLTDLDIRQLLHL